MRFAEFVIEYREPKSQRAHRGGIDLEAWRDGLHFQINATSHGRDLGRVVFDVQYQGNDPILVAQDLMIDPEYRGQGIAAVMYDYAKELGYTVERSPEQTAAGKAFWDKNRGEEGQVWESSMSLDLNTAQQIARELAAEWQDLQIARQGETNPHHITSLKQSIASLKKDLAVLGYEYDFEKRRLISNRRALGEIARIPQSELGDWGEKGTLEPPKDPVKKKELPGGSGYTYAVEKDNTGNIEIMIFDGEKLAAELDLFETQDPLNTWGVETVVVERPYRGQGLGKALYGIALSILGLTIEAGQTQTKHGQHMWLMLNSIPGVEVMGYNMVPTDRYKPHKGDHIVKQDADWTRYTFPVESGSRSMRSRRPGTGLYTSQATMIARWTGQ